MRLEDAAVNGRSAQILLKNSEIEVPRKSHLSAYSVVYVGSCHSNAYQSVVRGKTGRSAEPLRNIPSRLPAAP